MQKNKKSIFLIIVLMIVLIDCSPKPKVDESVEKRHFTTQQNPVEVTVIQKGTFRKELVNNGKLVALRKSELQFRVGEQLEKLSVRNGASARVVGQEVTIIRCVNPENQSLYKRIILSFNTVV